MRPLAARTNVRTAPTDSRDVSVEKSSPSSSTSISSSTPPTVRVSVNLLADGSLTSIRNVVARCSAARCTNTTPTTSNDGNVSVHTGPVPNETRLVLQNSVY